MNNRFRAFTLIELMVVVAIIVLLVIAIRAVTIMGLRLAILGMVLPAAVILTVTLVAAIHTRLQGILITGTRIAVFIVAMLLIPRLKLRSPDATTSVPQKDPPNS